MNKKNHDLTEGVAWQRLSLFALPILLGIFLQSFYTTVDAIILGRFAGKAALAAIESVYTLTKLPLNFFVGLSSGATIIISQYFGAKKIKSLSDACHTAIIFALVGGFLLSVVMILLSPIFIGLLKVPSSIVGDAHIYVIIYFGGFAASMTYNVGAGFFRALGNSKTPFYFLIVANILNIVLDLVFVALLGLGVAGAGFATILSQFLSAILVFAALVKTELPCKIYPRNIRFHRVHVNEFFKLGLPVGFQSTLYPISNMIIQTNINSFGVNSIAAWAICGKLDFLIWFVSDAFCSAVSTFVAQNYGAGLYKRVHKGVRTGSILALSVVSIVSVILYFWHVPFGRIFVKDAEVIALTSQIMLFLAPLYVLYVPGALLPSAIRATGESFKPMLITLAGTSLLRVLWIFFVVPFNPTLMTTLACYPVSWGLTSVLFLLYYATYMKKLKTI